MLKSPAQLAVAVVLTALTIPAQAEKMLPSNATAAEIAAMPDFCQAKMGGNAERYQYWNQRMGPDKFVHMHHYCHGLKWMNRATLTGDKALRRYYLTNAVNDFDYVLRNWPESFAVRADAKDRKAQAEARLRRL
jgi:hypothetical protein